MLIINRKSSKADYLKFVQWSEHMSSIAMSSKAFMDGKEVPEHETGLKRVKTETAAK